MRRFIALTLAVAFAATGCAKQGGNASPSGGGILRVAIFAEPSSLNPLLGTTTAENSLSSLIFDLLVTLDDRGNDIPDLAAAVPTLENGGISRDGKTITYKLRRGVKWQNGKPFTSADVKFSWQAVMNPNNNVVERTGYDKVSSVDTPDPYTVVFHLKTPFSPFVDTVFGESDDPFRIIPKHLLGGYANINRVPFNQQPIGTGPFRVVRWYHGDHVELEANPLYFRGVPKLKKILVYTVPDGNTSAAELQSHGIDLILAVTAANFRNLRSVAGVRTMLVKQPSYAAAVFNTKHPPLDDVRVRQAISYAINEKRIVDNLTYGTATLASADLSEFSWAHDPTLAGYTYDPAKANGLLDRAGWRRGPSGMRAKNGKTLTLQLTIGAGSQTANQIAVELQSDLRQVGVDLAIKTYSYSLLYATAAMGGIQQTGKFDMTLQVWVSGADPDDSSQWMCKQASPAGNNISRYCSAAFDNAEKTALTHFDRATRKRAYALTQQLLVKDAPATFEYYPQARYAMNPALQNFSPNGISEGWNAYLWSL
ncbi:MAG TPA: peptide ABC transporter substrate-binding protein [Candidatus Rubrimentiphilum sp.]|nr:peptide ABC transporter substrate-binding protein [Candidatus Rubrimentiphilum sp.]